MLRTPCFDVHQVTTALRVRIFPSLRPVVTSHPARATRRRHSACQGHTPTMKDSRFASHVQLVMNARKTVPLSRLSADPVPHAPSETPSLARTVPWVRGTRSAVSPTSRCAYRATLALCALRRVPRTTNRSATISRRWSTSLSALARPNWTRASPWSFSLWVAPRCAQRATCATQGQL